MDCNRCNREITGPYNIPAGICLRCTFIEEDGPEPDKWLSVKDRMPEKSCCDKKWESKLQDVDQIVPGTNIITTVLTEISICPECGGRYLTDKQANKLIEITNKAKDILK